MNIGVSSRVLLGSGAVVLVAAVTFAQQPAATPADATKDSAPAASAPATDAFSAEAKAVLDRAAALYHSYSTFQDRIVIATSFDFSGPNDSKQHMGSEKALVFRFVAKPWRFALKGPSGCIYGDDERFTTLDYGRPEKDGTYKPAYEKAKMERGEDGVIDWRDLSGSMGRILEGDPISALYMSGPKGTLDIFRKATVVEPGELNGQAGVWVKGKGLCPYTPGSGGGVDVTPIAAWFDAKTGELREVRYDIANTSWSQGALDSFAEKNGNPSTLKAEVVVRYEAVTVNGPMDEKLITDNKENQIEKVEIARKGGGMPAMRMGGKPDAKEAGGAGGMTPASTSGGMMPAMRMGPKAPAAADAAKDEKPTAAAPEVERAVDKMLNQPAPVYSAKTPGGADFKSADLKGKVVLLDFWATWCGPCMQAIPKIQELSVKFKDQDVAIIGINRDKAGDEDKVRKTIERRELTFGQVMDTDGAIAKAHKVTALPTVLLIDKEGVIRAVHVGYGPGKAELLADEINKLLKGEKLAAAKE